MRRWGAAWIFLGIWLSFLAIHGLLELAAEMQQAQDHGRPFELGSFALEWARSTFENLQSEAWQILAAVLLVDNVVARRRWFQASEQEAE